MKNAVMFSLVIRFIANAIILSCTHAIYWVAGAC